MCTLIALHRCFPGLPLLVAANRDEYYDRPAAPPAARPQPQGPVIAPLDLRAGGTWLGLSASGLFAAVTNRPCPEPDPQRRSRGLLVFEALSAGSADRAADLLAGLPAGAYNPFNLFVADRERAAVVTYEETPTRVDLQPGVHVVGNADPLGPPTPKLARLSADAGAAADAGSPEAVEERLAAICRGHESGPNGASPLVSTCVHTPAYGTRSSALLRLTSFPRGASLRFAEGAPCSTPYRDFTPLLRGLAEGHPQREEVQVARSAR